MKIYFEEKTIEVNNFNFLNSIKNDSDFLYLRCNNQVNLKLILDNFFSNKLSVKLYLETPVDWVKNYFHIIMAAGGIVKNQAKILFIYRNDKWDLPKGKLDKGETLSDAAVREVKEECGIKDLKLLSLAKITYHVYFLKGNPILKETHWFCMSSGQIKDLQPQEEEGITQIEWIGKEEISKVLNNTYPLILDIISDQF